MNGQIINKAANNTSSEIQLSEQNETTQNESLKVSLEEYKTIEEVFKTQREKNKLDLETLSIYAKLEGREKLSRWEKLRTIVPWLGIIGTLIFSLITYNYQRDKDRVLLEKEREAIEQRQNTEKAEKEGKEKKENELKQKEKREEQARDDALARAQEKDREEARRYRETESKQNEKDREEARNKREAELRQLQEAREARLKQEAADNYKRNQDTAADARHQTERALERKNTEIDNALKMIKDGKPIVGINKLASFGEETLPFIINEVNLEKSEIDWSTKAFAALGAIRRIGLDKLTPVEKVILSKRLDDCVNEVNSLGDFFSQFDGLHPDSKLFGDALKEQGFEPMDYKRRLNDAKFTWQLMFQIANIISPDSSDLLTISSSESCNKYFRFKNPNHRRLASGVCRF